MTGDAGRPLPASHCVVPRIVCEAVAPAPVHGARSPRRTPLTERCRRPSAPTYLTAGTRHGLEHGLEHGRRASAQAEAAWGENRRPSGGRGSSELGSAASLHEMAERLYQPLPSRRCSLLDERTRRLSRFAEDEVAGRAPSQRPPKSRARRFFAGVGVLIALVAVAMVGISLAMSTRIDDISEYKQWWSR